MKKIIVVIVLVGMISFAVQASPCRPYLILNGTSYYWGTTSVTIGIKQGDTLICSVGAASPCGACKIDAASTQWTFRGIHINGVTIAATDTGIYTLNTEGVPDGSFCPFEYGTFYVTIYYITTSVTELVSANNILVSPTLSTGIFKVNNNAQYRIKNLIVSDEAGRIIYTSSTDFSEINLTRFSSGIYFYAIEDETQKVFRGKIIKN